MSASPPTPERRRRSRRLFWIAAVIVVPLFSTVYFVFIGNVEVINVDSHLRHASEPDRAAYFARHFMTSEEIEAGFSDITIVDSNDVGDVKRGLHSYINEVYYIRDHIIVQWGDTDNPAKLANGKWQTTPWLQLLYWSGRVRPVENHAFCMIMPTNLPPNEPICTVASDLGYLQGLIMPPHTEMRKGDVFNLWSATKPPLILMTKEPISFASLLRALGESKER